MTALDPDIFDCPFHAAALAAYLEQAALCCGPPDSEATRRRAFELFEQARAEKHRSQHP